MEVRAQARARRQHELRAFLRSPEKRAVVRTKSTREEVVITVDFTPLPTSSAVSPIDWTTAVTLVAEDGLAEERLSLSEASHSEWLRFLFRNDQEQSLTAAFQSSWREINNRRVVLEAVDAPSLSRVADFCRIETATNGNWWHRNAFSKKENNNSIGHSDISPRIVFQFPISPTELPGVLQAAHFLQIEGLSRLCCQMIAHNVDDIDDVEELPSDMWELVLLHVEPAAMCRLEERVDLLSIGVNIEEYWRNKSNQKASYAEEGQCGIVSYSQAGSDRNRTLNNELQKVVDAACDVSSARIACYALDQIGPFVISHVLRTSLCRLLPDNMDIRRYFACMRILRQLTVHDCILTDADLLELCGALSTSCPQLEDLRLLDIGLQSNGASIVGCHCPPSVRYLDLGGNHIADCAPLARALLDGMGSSVPVARSIVGLSLREQYRAASSTGVHVLYNLEALAPLNLQDLDLACNILSDNVDWLQVVPCRARKLDLSGTAIALSGDAKVRPYRWPNECTGALSSALAKVVGTLETLQLRGIQWNDHQLEDFAHALFVSLQKRCLPVAANNVRAAGNDLKVIPDNATESNQFQLINVSGGMLEAGALRRFGELAAAGFVEQLDFSDNLCVGDANFVHFATQLIVSPSVDRGLKRLNVQRTGLTDRSVDSILQLHEKFPDMELDVSANSGISCSSQELLFATSLSGADSRHERRKTLFADAPMLHNAFSFVHGRRHMF